MAWPAILGGIGRGVAARVGPRLAAHTAARTAARQASRQSARRVGKGRFGRILSGSVKGGGLLGLGSLASKMFSGFRAPGAQGEQLGTLSEGVAASQRQQRVGPPPVAVSLLSRAARPRMSAPTAIAPTSRAVARQQGDDEFVTFKALYNILPGYVTNERYANDLNQIAVRVGNLDRSTASLADLIKSFIDSYRIQQRVDAGRAKEEQSEARYRQAKTDDQILQEVRGKGEANTRGLIEQAFMGLVSILALGIGGFGKELAETLENIIDGTTDQIGNAIDAIDQQVNQWWDDVVNIWDDEVSYWKNNWQTELENTTKDLVMDNPVIGPSLRVGEAAIDYLTNPKESAAVRKPRDVPTPGPMGGKHLGGDATPVETKPTPPSTLEMFKKQRLDPFYSQPSNNGEKLQTGSYEAKPKQTSLSMSVAPTPKASAPVSSIMPSTDIASMSTLSLSPNSSIPDVIYAG